MSGVECSRPGCFWRGLFLSGPMSFVLSATALHAGLEIRHFRQPLRAVFALAGERSERKDSARFEHVPESHFVPDRNLRSFLTPPLQGSSPPHSTTPTMKETLAVLALAAVLAHADRTILITPSSQQQLVPPHPCLADGFYGRYGRPLKDVYIVSSACAIEAVSVQNSGSMAYLPHDGADVPLVWLEEAAVDDTLRRSEKDSFWLKMTTLSANLNEECRKHSFDNAQQEQLVMSGSSSPSQQSTLYYLNPTSALISVPASRLPLLDTYLPRFAVPTILPSKPLQNIPIDTHAVKRLQHILSKLQFNPTIAAAVSALNIDAMRKDIRWLTGENEESGILSRHSFTSGARVAADWIQGEIEKSGAVCEQREFANGFAPNVIWYVCVYEHQK